MERRTWSSTNNASWSVIKARRISSGKYLFRLSSKREGLQVIRTHGTVRLLDANKSYARVSPFWANRFALSTFSTPLSERRHDAN